MSSKKEKTHRSLHVKLANEISAFLFALGNQFVRMNNASAAFDCFKYSVDMRPDHQPSVFNLGTLYSICGDKEGAYRMLKEAARMDPSDTSSKIALAEVCRKSGRMAETEQLLRTVLSKEPDHPAAASAMAIMMYDQCRLAEAGQWNERAIELNPRDTALQLNRALLNMVYGHWPKWWGVYEQMLSYQAHNSKMRGLRIQDSWDGSEHPGKTLLVISDQGAGDAIQFGRFLGRAREKGKFGKLTYLVPADLKPLIAKFDGIDEVVAFGERDRLDRDQFASLLGIMRVLGVGTDDARTPPLRLRDVGEGELWRNRLARESNGQGLRKVALVWAGDAAHGNDFARSMPLAALAPILDLPGHEFFSFQVGPPAAQCAPLNLPEIGSQFTSYLDTAHAMLQMDLVVSVDTSACHLAGTLGIPTMLMVPSTPEWRWLLTRKDSVWYDSVEIFRQPSPGDWGSVVASVRKRMAHT
jgi:hypothetical protein